MSLPLPTFGKITEVFFEEVIEPICRNPDIQTHLSTVSKIDREMLKRSMDSEKGGYSVPTLKTYAKHLGIRTTQSKSHLAKDIYEYIRELK